MDQRLRKQLALRFDHLLAKRRQALSVEAKARTTMVQTAPTTTERRRRAVNLEVTFVVAGQAISGKAIDLSASGIGICASSNVLGAGTELEVILRAPDSDTDHHPLKLRGIVCHHSGSRFGVRFTNLTPGDETRIRSILEVTPDQ